jgi:FAD/FMN-containing dehydrogenase
MGNSQSLAPASQAGSPLQLCLNDVFASSSGTVAYPQSPFYQLADVKVYNQHIPIIPAAVTRPTTSEEVSKVVQCAVASAVKVQARSGGHSYANYGKQLHGSGKPRVC